MKTWKFASQQYRACSDCRAVQAGLALYWWQRLITSGFARIRFNIFFVSKLLQYKNNVCIVHLFPGKFVNYTKQSLSTIVPKLAYLPHAEDLVSDFLQVRIVSLCLVIYFLACLFWRKSQATVIVQKLDCIALGLIKTIKGRNSCLCIWFNYFLQVRIVSLCFLEQFME